MFNGPLFFYFDSTEASKIKFKETVWTTNSQLDLMDLGGQEGGEWEEFSWYHEVTSTTALLEDHLENSYQW